MPEARQSLITEPWKVGAKQALLAVLGAFVKLFYGFSIILHEQPVYFEPRDLANVSFANLVEKGE